MAKRKSSQTHKSPTTSTTLFGDNSFETHQPDPELKSLESEAQSHAMQYIYPKIPRKYWISVGTHKSTNLPTLIINTTEFTPTHFLSHITFPCTQIHDIHDLSSTFPSHLYFQPFVTGGYLTITSPKSYCVDQTFLGEIHSILKLHTLDE